ncbi:replication protein A 32 kDa subunit-like isoform X2 [Girardinichthys multiradiatus]|uniref:replication protein A 32 kDa subunit-like isoform X2 n=1 Tax=Girardinichthys multiradiatus TaxID=208333 RepID=UPI001FAB6546|nr:replication protein A 32 kDa subunit-like isoform X2 [Girardinichthys multiradiatus]
MWNQGCSHSIVGTSSYKTAPSKKAHLEIFPCTVSQLLAAAQLSNDCFTICNCELKQVSVVGIIRGFAPFVTNVQYSVDDMTGPPLNVKRWVNVEDCSLMTIASPGTYAKVIGSLHSYSVFDVNMNTTVVPEPDWSSGMDPQDVLPNGLSTVQGQVLHLIQMFSDHDKGISFHDLRTKLDYISMRDIRSSLAFLINEGHIFSTIDEHHFKSE